METIIGKLVDAFERGQMNRRDLVRNLAVAALALGGSGAARELHADGGTPSEAGPTGSAEPDAFRTLGLDHISFSVSDYARSRDFYTELMGWEVVNDDGERQAELQMGDLGRILIRNSRTPFTGTPTAVIDHMAWQIADWTTSGWRTSWPSEGSKTWVVTRASDPAARSIRTPRSVNVATTATSSSTQTGGECRSTTRQAAQNWVGGRALP